MFGLPFWAVKAIGIAVLLAVVAGVGARLAKIWYAPQVAGLTAQIKGADAQAKAVKVIQTSLTKANGDAEDKAQAKILVQTQLIIKKVPVYVSSKSAVGCITNGMLRLHDAAVLGIDPADLRPPAGQPDDACSSVKPGDYMAVIIANYAAARANAEQLDSLSADLKSRIEAVDPEAKER